MRGSKKDTFNNLLLSSEVSKGDRFVLLGVTGRDLQLSQIYGLSIADLPELGYLKELDEKNK